MENTLSSSSSSSGEMKIGSISIQSAAIIESRVVEMPKSVQHELAAMESIDASSGGFVVRCTVTSNQNRTDQCVNWGRGQ